MEWRFVWSRGDEHETGRALSREMLRLYRDKAREKRDVPPDIGTVFIGNNGKPMTTPKIVMSGCVSAIFF